MHADLERQPRAGRRLVEDQRHAAALQRPRREPIALQLDGAVEQPVELLGRKLLSGEEVTQHPRIVVRAVTWNLWHGQAGSVHDYVAALGGLEWDVALLQEAPPRWRGALARELGAESAIVLTPRNSGAPIRSWIADRWPRLIKSNEGGSNQVLVRGPWQIAERREHTLTRRPER